MMLYNGPRVTNICDVEQLHLTSIYLLSAKRERERSILLLSLTKKSKKLIEVIGLFLFHSTSTTTPHFLLSMEGKIFNGGAVGILEELIESAEEEVLLASCRLIKVWFVFFLFLGF